MMMSLSDVFGDTQIVGRVSETRRMHHKCIQPVFAVRTHSHTLSWYRKSHLNSLAYVPCAFVLDAQNINVENKSKTVRAKNTKLKLRK